MLLWGVLFLATFRTGLGAEEREGVEDEWEVYRFILPAEYWQTVKQIGLGRNETLLEHVLSEGAVQSARLFLDTINARQVYLGQWVSCSCPAGLPEAEALNREFRWEPSDVQGVYKEGAARSLHMSSVVLLVDQQCPKAQECRRVFGRRMIEVCGGHHDGHFSQLFWQRLLVAEWPDFFKPLLHHDFLVWFERAWALLLSLRPPLYWGQGQLTEPQVEMSHDLVYYRQDSSPFPGPETRPLDVILHAAKPHSPAVLPSTAGSSYNFNFNFSPDVEKPFSITSQKMLRGLRIQ